MPSRTLRLFAVSVFVLGLGACANDAPSMLESCLRYCTQLRACDKTGAIDDKVAETCRNQCQAASVDAKQAIDARKLECSDQSDCTAFATCLNPPKS